MAGQVKALAARLDKESLGGRALTPKDALVLRLNAQYPADVGVLSAYFLNLVVLEPNQVRTPVTERSLRCMSKPARASHQVGPQCVAEGQTAEPLVQTMGCTAS